MEDNPTQLSDTEQVDWLRLVRTPSIGPRTYIELIERYGSPAAAITELPEIAQRARGKRRLVAPPEADIRAELSRLDAAGGRMIALSDPDYPAALAVIADPPPALFLRGYSTLLNNPTIAIVGARNASTNGKRFAQEIAAGLGNAGYVIVSGLARGVDGAAHLGALATGRLLPLRAGSMSSNRPNTRNRRPVSARQGPWYRIRPSERNRRQDTLRPTTESFPACRPAYWWWKRPSNRGQLLRRGWRSNKGERSLPDRGRLAIRAAAGQTILSGRAPR